MEILEVLTMEMTMETVWVIYILVQEVKKTVVTLAAIQAVILVVILEETPEEIQVVTQELVNLKKNLLNLLCQNQ
jgi:hypothetical protein